MKALLFLSIFWSFSSLAVELKFEAKLSPNERQVLSNSFEEILSKVPAKFKAGLPSVIRVSLQNLKGPDKMPNVCNSNVPFTYGKYTQVGHLLILNKALLSELEKGEAQSEKINCLHGSLYKVAMATILHELTHAYDLNNKRPSKSPEFLNAGGFSKFLLLESKRNKNPMRSMDEYEYKDSFESLAVNMEYFVFDKEYACRRPVMFNYLKNHFGEVPTGTKSCDGPMTVMVRNQLGFSPYKIDTSRVYRIDYLLASKGNDAASSFGHSMFRIVVCAPEHIDPTTKVVVPATPFGPRCLEDKLFHIVGSFRANTEGANLNYLKGIVGGYSSMLFMLSLTEVVDEYNLAEMRDLTAYPLMLSENEKINLFKRLVEIHWDYKGNYRFISNNCAVETFNSLEGIIISKNQSTNTPKQLTPNGLAEVLADYKMINMEDPNVEVFKARTMGLLNAFDVAYLKKSTEKKFKKFIYESSLKSRSDVFKNILSQETSFQDEKDLLIQLKKQSVRIASFSLIEQQVIRTKANELQKKLAEYASDKKKLKSRPEHVKIFAELLNKSTDVASIKTSGYGIPTEEEAPVNIITSDVVEDSLKKFEIAANILSEVFPEEKKEIDDSATFLGNINETANLKRKDYKSRLDKYIFESIKELSLTNEGINLLSEAKNGNTENLRKYLGDLIMTKTEITDLKLKKIINESIVDF